MFIEIVDSLRCPNPHAESWLVASCDVMDHRDITEGRLGCPVCKAEYLIRDGAVWFDPPRPAPAADMAASESEAVRIAAFLELTDANGFAILHGEWAAQAALVSAIAPTQLVLFNPPAAVAAQPGFSSVYCDRRPPFATGSARAVAMGAGGLALVDALKPGGRALGVASLPVPAELAEVARDQSVWVAEKTPGVVRVTLTGRSGG